MLALANESRFVCASVLKARLMVLSQALALSREATWGAWTQVRLELHLMWMWWWA